MNVRCRLGSLTAALLLVLSPAPAARAADLYARAFVDTAGQLRIVTRDGREIVPKKAADQVGFARPQISEDRFAVGWLAEYPNGATSYPVPLRLVIYSQDRMRTYSGHDLPVWRWAFQARGKHVAFEQETVHGGLGIHYELHDVATGRLIAEYTPAVGSDGHALPDQTAPKWVRLLDARR